MIIGYGDRGVLLLGLVAADLETLQSGRTLTYENTPTPFLTKDVVLFYAETKEDMVRMLKDGGVTISGPLADAYMAGQRTDHPRKEH